MWYDGRMKYKAAIFDMDGTILDTVGDLTDAINHTLGVLEIPGTVSYEDAKFMFGSGVRVALIRAVALLKGIAGTYELLKVGTERDDITGQVDPDLITKAEGIMKPYYAAHNDIKTGQYPGTGRLLEDLRSAGIKTAVVSNKPDESVRALSDKLFPGLFDAAVGEQPGLKRKPAPDMIEKTLRELNTDRKDAVYIGDSEIDLQTAENSGLDCITVTWGFRSREFLTEHGAVIFADSAPDVFKLIHG